MIQRNSINSGVRRCGVYRSLLCSLYADGCLASTHKSALEIATGISCRNWKEARFGPVCFNQALPASFQHRADTLLSRYCYFHNSGASKDPFSFEFALGSSFSSLLLSRPNLAARRHLLYAVVSRHQESALGLAIIQGNCKPIDKFGRGLQPFGGEGADSPTS